MFKSIDFETKCYLCNCTVCYFVYVIDCQNACYTCYDTKTIKLCVDCKMPVIELSLYCSDCRKKRSVETQLILNNIPNELINMATEYM